VFPTPLTGQCRAFVTQATEVDPKPLFGHRRRLAFSELEEVPTQALVWAVDLDD
jgi:hypothetical protein